jgi:hypothetical protein
VPALNALQKKYKDGAAFYVVYIQEAHPVDLWQMQSNVKEHVLVKSTKTLEERSHAASSCVLRLGINIPAVIDGPDDRVERAYTGWPDRLYVIDRDGRIAFKSAAGPFGFEPEKVAATLQQLLGT